MERKRDERYRNPRRRRRTRPLAAFLALLLFLGAAAAQTVTFGVTARAGLPNAGTTAGLAPGFEGGTSATTLAPFVGIGDVPLAGGRVDARLRVASDGAFGFGLGFRTTTSAGPVGNLTIRGRVDADSAGFVDAHVGGDGVIGPVAARVRLGMTNAPPGRFDVLEIVAFRQPPPAGVLAGDVAIGGTYRIDRTTILDVDASGLVEGGGVGVVTAANLRFSRLVDTDDGVVLAQAHVARGFERGHLAVGAEYRFNRRNLPAARIALLAGVGSEGFAPGFRVSVVEARAAQPVRYTVELHAEPYRTDVPPYRVLASFAADAGEGEALVRIGSTRDAGRTVVTATAGYRFGF